jgi:hypothetical protein
MSHGKATNYRKTRQMRINLDINDRQETAVNCLKQRERQLSRHASTTMQAWHTSNCYKRAENSCMPANRRKKRVYYRHRQERHDQQQLTHLSHYGQKNGEDAATRRKFLQVQNKATLSKPPEMYNGLRQEDALARLLFHIALEKAVLSRGLKPLVTYSVSLFTY